MNPMADYGFTEESVAAYQEKSKSWTGKRITRKEALETATAIMKAAEDERKPKKPSKYRNEKTEVDGIIFGSAKEGNRYLELKLLEKAGIISDLKLQVPFVLAESVVLDGRKKPSIKYYADFTYTGNRGFVVEDVKGGRSGKLAVYRLKKHLMMSVHGIEIIEP